MKFFGATKAIVAALLAAILVQTAGAQVGATVLPVDALNGTDSVGSSLYKSIRFAISQAPAGTSRVMVRGRRNAAGNAVLHTDTIESWSTAGTITVPANLSIEWDSANSTLVGGVPTPVVVTGNLLAAGAGPAAFTFSAPVSLTRANVKIKGIQIVAFDTGVEWKPTATPTLLGVTLDTVRFNQCTRGFHLEPLTTTPVDPLVSACSFENTAMPPTIGGDRTGGLTSLVAHVDLVGDDGDVFRGDYNNCLFTTDTATATGAPIFVSFGFSSLMAKGASCTFTVMNCDFQGNGVSTGTVHGMLHGFYFNALGQMPASNFLVRNCYFQNCGYTGMTLIASGQGVVVKLPEGGWDYDPPETFFLVPEVRRCTFVLNGYVAAGLTGPISLDWGHGLVTRTWKFGQMQPYVHLCDNVGTSAGHANLGITGNAFDGVYIHSDWWLPSVNNEYESGNITYTRNDTWLETSRISTNLRHGVEIHLEEGSGNPGVKANRIFDDGADGVHVEASGSPDAPDTRDLTVATPVTWNNFIYQLAGGSPVQQNGFFGRFIEGTFNGTMTPNILGGMGVLHNTSTNHAVNGIDAQVIPPLLLPGWSIQSVQNNISYFNAGLDLVMNLMINSYDCAANATGTTDITGNPLLVSYTTGDLHLTATSPCLDIIGMQWPPLPYSQTMDDFDLQARPNHTYFDMGADERW